MAGSKKQRNKRHNKLKTAAARRAVEALAQGIEKSGRVVSDRELAKSLADIQQFAFSNAHRIAVEKKQPILESEADEVLKIVYEAFDNIESGDSPTERDVGFIEACITTVAKHAIDVKNKSVELLAEQGLIAMKAMRARRALLGSYRFDGDTKPFVLDCLNKYIEIVAKLNAGDLQKLGEFVQAHDYRVNAFGVAA